LEVVDAQLGARVVCHLQRLKAGFMDCGSDFATICLATFRPHRLHCAIPSSHTFFVLTG
jgi:hypothetical protein